MCRERVVFPFSFIFRQPQDMRDTKIIAIIDISPPHLTNFFFFPFCFSLSLSGVEHLSINPRLRMVRIAFVCTVQ
ncbi:hypothetical protein I7I53_05889 [Histoplasma capsulatum var. duboisii H88]|uniref:Uncharacterized protein n=1 Tax=Ajellomyces capsulatus (strain H88) TaxID=544711 RepID=A0A8A1L9L2_AJEC8|nr:hypothetical protein I7I53_05889 [Histoplasma capsulatum var. duboisii H88]